MSRRIWWYGKRIDRLPKAHPQKQLSTLAYEIFCAKRPKGMDYEFFDAIQMAVGRYRQRLAVDPEEAMQCSVIRLRADRTRPPGARLTIDLVTPEEAESNHAN